MEEGKIARVLQDFFTTTEGELSLQKGDIVQILKMIDKLWCYGYNNGRTGNMPLNYLIVINYPDLNPGEELFVAIASFPAQQSGDLSFERGDLIVGVERVDDNWWQGQIETRKGLFPTTYTWQLDSTVLKKKSRQSSMSIKALVKKDMKAQLEEEIDLHAGEVITVLEVIDKDWYRGESRGQIGVFPAAFVSLMNESESSQQTNSSWSSSLLNASKQSSYSTNSSDVDGPPSYYDVCGSTVQNTALSASCSSASASCDVFDDDYFKQNAPNTFFGEQNDNRLDVFETGHTKDLGLVPYGISLYPFHAQFDNELSFKENEIITLLRYVGKDWMEGKVNDRKGIFPCNYVNIIVDCNRDSDSDTSSVHSALESSASCSDLETDSFAVVLYNFDSQMNGDLSVSEGEVVYVIEQANESWCKVRNHAGEIGLCPRNYLTLHGSSNKGKNALFQRFSLANDNLLQDPPRNASDIFDRSSENRRSYHCDDFSSESHSKVSVDDLISMNLDNLKVHSTWHPKPTLSTKNVADIFGRSSNESLSERSDNLSVSSQNQNSVEGRIPSPAVAQLDWQNNISQPSSKQSSTLSLLDEPVPPTVPVVCASPAPIQPSRFAPPVPVSRLRRQVSDRVPHRPAPPVPLPGQKPTKTLEHFTVCSHSERFNHNSESEISSKENQLKYLLKMREQTMQKIGSDELDEMDTTDGEVNLKLQVSTYDEKIKVLMADLQRLKGAEIERPCVAQRMLTSEEGASANIGNDEERRVRNMEQRQNVISELVMTEKEYVRDLKITFEVFNLHDSSKLESRGINVKILFGNIFEVMKFAEDFLDKLRFSMKGKEEEEQCIGVVFLESSDRMKSVYGEYCMNHDNALSHLEKYESEQEVQKVFNKGLETLRYQIACFDMSSILIKPVQRILKYPLILNELIKCTHDLHKDKPGLLEAVKTIMDVATYINECKRRKDIVSKYLVDGNDTISSKMSRISLHSVAKKSTRLGMLVQSTLGFGAVNKDPAFTECEAGFHAIEKTIRVFLKNVESFVIHLHEVVRSQCYIAEGFAHFYPERHSDVEDFARIQKLINSQYFKEFESTVRSRVTVPLNTVLALFEGPAILVQKRYDKFLDYNACAVKAEKNKEVKIAQDELLIAKNNYLALNDQLLEELPTLVSVSSDLFVECLSSFVTSRKLFTAKVMKHYLAVLEQSKTIATSTDVVESCCVRYNLVLNQLCRLSFMAAKKSTNSPTPKLKLSTTDNSSLEVKDQTSSQRAYLQSQYRQDMLYTVIKPCIANEPLELTVNLGHLVGVIKKQNPMGDPKIWFVDDGATRGFVPFNHLKETYSSPASQRHSVAVMPTYQTVQLPGAESAQKVPYSWSLKKGMSPYAYRNSAQAHLYSEIASEDTSYQTKQFYENVSVNESPPRYCEIPDDIESAVDVYYVMYDFQGDGDRTLSIKTGEAVKILQKHDAENNCEWWLAEGANGKKGFVPGNFVGKRTQ